MRTPHTTVSRRKIDQNFNAQAPTFRRGHQCLGRCTPRRNGSGNAIQPLSKDRISDMLQTTCSQKRLAWQVRLKRQMKLTQRRVQAIGVPACPSKVSRSNEFWKGAHLRFLPRPKRRQKPSASQNGVYQVGKAKIKDDLSVRTCPSSPASLR